MQFIRSGSGGAKSCRVTWSHPAVRLKITLFPMAHLASSSFYQRVRRELEPFDYILYEGVSWRAAPTGHRLYDLAARSFKLAAQEEALRWPAKGVRINIDMPYPEFRTRFKALPLYQRLLLTFLRPLMWAISKLPDTKRELFTSITVGKRSGTMRMSYT